jgi:hypothetical protein
MQFRHRYFRKVGSVATRIDVVLEALGMFGAAGATREMIYDLIQADLNGNDYDSRSKSLTNALSRANHEKELIVRHEGRYYLSQFAPEPAKPALHKEHRAEIAPYTAQAKGKRVSIFTSPIVLENVVALALCNDAGWHKIPLFGSVRLCIGRETPMWSADQVTYTGMTRIRLTHKDGSSVEETAAPKDWITIAPDE